jgi:hypothetical protein
MAPRPRIATLNQSQIGARNLFRSRLVYARFLRNEFRAPNSVRFMESPDDDRIPPWDLEPFMLGTAACPTSPMGIHPRSDRLGKETEPCQRFMERSP